MHSHLLLKLCEWIAAIYGSDSVSQLVDIHYGM